jgi:RNA polymerase sigma factor (sigma-70 family)
MTVYRTYFSTFGAGNLAVLRSGARSHLVTTAMNVVRDLWRRSRVRAAGQHEPLSENEDALRSIEDEDRLPFPDAIRLMEAELPNLWISTRKVFLLHHAEYLSFEEIAQEMGISTRMVEREMAQAISHLQATLGDPLKNILE